MWTTKMTNQTEQKLVYTSGKSNGIVDHAEKEGETQISSSKKY